MTDDVKVKGVAPTATFSVATDDDGLGNQVQIVKLATSGNGDRTPIPADVANGIDVDVTRVQGSVSVVDGGGSLTVDGSVEIANDVGNPIPVSGTVTITDGSGPVTVDGSVGISTNPGLAEVSGSASSAAVLTNFPVNSDTYRWASVQLTGTYSGTVVFEGSNDNSNWVLISFLPSTGTNSTPVTSTTTTGIWHGPLPYKYFRLRVSSYTSGTVNATVEFAQIPMVFTSMGLGSITPGTGAAQLGKAEDAAHISGDTGIMMMGVRNDSRGSLAGTDGDYVPPQFNASGDLRIDGSASTQPVSQSGTWTIQPGNTANTTAWLIRSQPWSVSSQTSLTTTATVSGGAGQYGGGSLINLNSSPAYLQVFDTTGAVSLGTTVPTFVQPIPANSTPANGAAFIDTSEAGITMANGIKVAATTTPLGATTVSTGLTGFVKYR